MRVGEEPGEKKRGKKKDKVSSLVLFQNKSMMILSLIANFMSNRSWIAQTFNSCGFGCVHDGGWTRMSKVR